MKNKRYFPLFVDLSDKNVVVVGGGEIATRRIKTLLYFTRNVTVGTKDDKRAYGNGKGRTGAGDFSGR